MTLKETPTHIYFWGTEFSNMYRCTFTYKEHLFFATEQAFMWEKARFFKDVDTASKILLAKNSGECKTLGREVTPFDRDIWFDKSYDVMRDVNFSKWSQNKYLTDILLKTSNKILVEGSPDDTLWGVGLHYNDPLILSEINWKGINRAGKMLMEIRDMLRK